MSIIGEAILPISIEMLFKKLASTDLLQFARQEQIQADLKKWEKLLENIMAVLDDAEEKQERQSRVKIWLDHLQSLAYDVEDILDEFATEALRRKLLDEPQANRSKVMKLIPSCCSSLNPRSLKFNSKMASEMKEITTRLQDIVTQKNLLDLKEPSGGRSNKVGTRLPTTSLVNEAKVYGRRKEQDAIVELLLKDDLSSEGGVSVIPIIGMGGLGKTTLAQLVYNDHRLKDHFNLKAWVCVSDEFDVMGITKEILSSIDHGMNDVNNLNKLQEELKQKLFKNKFLIVLDDIWNENPPKWTALRLPFEGGSPGSKIIVTTRNESVSTMMGTCPPYLLEVLSDEDCLCVFTQYALGRTDFCMHQHLKEVGGKIVKKCNGLPLAAETLGCLLRGKVECKDWEDVLNSKIWDFDEERSNILPALRVSYYYLPSHLKRCFAYCSLFPKDYEFLKEEIILLWMAEGLLQRRNNEKQMEDLGCEYFQDLKSRSFFQQSRKVTSRFVMHDLINDLSQWAARETCFRIENSFDSAKGKKISENLRHLSFIREKYNGVKKFEAFYEAKRLRTFLSVALANRWRDSFLTYDVLLHMLPKLPYLRVLSLRQYEIFELPDTIGELKLLRYLDLSKTQIQTLPGSISTLYNLETLLLERCFRLKKLCTDIGYLINMHHLNNSYADALKEMPTRIGNLIGLQTLPNFVVGKDSGSSLAELKSLKHIKGRLCISGLENVNLRDAKQADLNGKRDINVLELKWNGCIDDSREAGNEMHVLDMLRPHQDLKELIIEGYGGTLFPIWLGDPSFSNLLLLRLENCSKCTYLPSVGQLPLLKELYIRRMAGVKSIGPEFYTCSEPFPSLETLCFEDMREWEDWIPHGPDQEVEGCPQLRELYIKKCPKLVGRLPERLPSLERLVIRNCKQLLVSVSSLANLRELEIDGCKELVQRSTIDLSSQNSVLFSDISNLVCPAERFTKELSKVEELEIVHWKELTSLWRSGIELLQDNRILRRLVIRQCPQLLCLVADEEDEQQQQGLPCRLQYLELSDCESFIKLPQALCNFSFLTKLSIRDCPKLVSFPDNGIPHQLRIVEIESCNALKFLPKAWMCRSSIYLEDLLIRDCLSLTYIAKRQLPPKLKLLQIKGCRNLRTLIDEERGPTMHGEITDNGNSRNTSVLEYLKIDLCSSLTSLWSKSELPATLEHIELYNCSNLAFLSSRGNLPKVLKNLLIYKCSKLESIAERLENHTSLECIKFDTCENLKRLPKNLHNLRHLQEIRIRNCQSLVSFPEGGLSLKSLTKLAIEICEKLEALPNCMHNLTSLKSLTIEECPAMVSFPDYGLPTSLTSLYIKNVEICKPLFDWGLDRLTSLTSLTIIGGCPDVESFPQEEIHMTLPASLTYLYIMGFPNLERISPDIQNLTSLEELSLGYCPKVKTFPEKGLPPSLLELFIWCCPMLEQTCKKDRGKYWPMIAHIPVIRINMKFVYQT